ncbi:MAG TPA: hypothetical protein VF591_21590 [Pyrinomonadaceae bacterium]|jgi:hypothetical protein
MSTPISTYSFLPWLRQGIANRITAADSPANVKIRAAVPVHLELAGEGVGGALAEPIQRDVELYGPGDIVGIEPRAVVKVEPRSWVPDFETNYLPHIEFYDEDFPWRYTPAAAAGARLRPWIMLVVLKEGEFEEGVNVKDKPLPYIKVDDPRLFPPAGQLWAWAHVHVNRGLAASVVSSDMNVVLPNFQAVLRENPDLAYSRIVCPRKLEENSSYHAFLVPSFESGRLAGLGLDVTKAPSATHSAWGDYAGRAALEGSHYPVYYRWRFGTATVGDFEYLVRLLKPKPVDRRVGRREMDMQRPGPNLPGIGDPALGGVLRLGGALRVPEEAMSAVDRAEAEKFDDWDNPYPHPFQTALASFINLADDYAAEPAAQANSGSGLEGVEDDPDPLITPPLYGRWHSLTRRLLAERDGSPVALRRNWVHELNLDPRYRVPAGFGTKVVQDKQEEYVNAAWEQVGQVLEANRRIRASQLAKEVSWVWHERHLKPLRAADVEKFILLAAPVHKRVVSQGLTVYHQVKSSHLQPAAVSAPLRRVLRPGARLARGLPFGDAVRPGNLLSRINDGEVSAAPPKVVPPGVVTVNDAVATVSPQDAPAPLIDLLRRYPWLVYVPLALALLVLLVLLILALLFGASTPLLVAGLVIPAALAYLYRLLSRWADAVRRSDSGSEENQTEGNVDGLPRSPDFTVSEPGAGVTPTRGATDGVEAVNFKEALKDVGILLKAGGEAGKPPDRVTLDLPVLADTTLQTVDPEVTIPGRTWQTITLPPHIAALLGEGFREVMAYPRIESPMYEPLADISSELFLPNINLIEQNSITLLETNQKFIESYMVGLNHEFARELLWREYPTDMMGSYFRQFWDVSTFLGTQGPSDEELREKLRDIPELHRWSRSSELGEHDNREVGGAKEEEVVLVIRGELLKRYPNAVIYAHKARWQEKADGSADKTKERRLAEPSAAEEAQPPRDRVKTPLYKAKVAPDVYFFGFDLTVDEARGDTGDYPDKSKPGWFFVIKERPGEPRFGLDLTREGALNVWNDLSWEDLIPRATGSSFIEVGGHTSFNLVEPAAPEVQEKKQQYDDDKFVKFDSDSSSADLAYVLYQVPVLVAVHASEMLPK